MISKHLPTRKGECIVNVDYKKNANVYSVRILCHFFAYF